MQKLLLLTAGIILPLYPIIWIYDYVELHTYSLYPYGNELLNLESDLWIFMIIMALLHLFLLAITTFIYSTKKLKWLAYGMLTTVIFSIGINSKIAFENVDKAPRVVEFNKEVWDKSNNKPITMIRYFDGFRFFSRKSAESLFGPSTTLPEGSPLYYDTSSLYYITDQTWEDKPYYLELGFNEDSACTSRNLFILHDSD